MSELWEDGHARYKTTHFESRVFHATTGLHLAEDLLDEVVLVEQMKEKTCARRRGLVFHPPFSRRAGGFFFRHQRSPLRAGCAHEGALRRRACVGRATRWGHAHVGTPLPCVCMYAGFWHGFWCEMRDEAAKGKAGR